MTKNGLTLVSCLALLFGPSLVAQEKDSLEESAKKTQNPVADQIKVQFENYFNFGMDSNNVTQYVGHVIPTID